MIIISGEQLVDLAGNRSDVLVTATFGCKKVSLDIRKIKKPEKVFSTYKIPKDEHLIAYCKGILPLFGLTLDGLVFTDKAFYPFPRDTNPLPSNRIPYADLCKYIITQESDKGAVFLQSGKIEYEIYSGTLIQQNTAGLEIRHILEAIQTDLCRQSVSAKEMMDNAVTEFFNLAKVEMKSDILSTRMKTVLKAISTKQNYCDDAVYLLAENLFRQCSESDYQAFLAELPLNISLETKAELAQIPKRFADALLQDLSNPNIIFADSYLNKVYGNLRDQSESQTYLSAYALTCMRITRCDTARETISKIAQEYGVNATYLLEDFICIYGNQQMQAAFKVLCEGGEITEKQLHLRDGLGLTPLHYAMILQNTEALSDILCRKNWSEETQHLKKTWLRDIYDYQVLACAKPELDRPELFYHVNPDVKSISEIILKLKQQEDEMYQALIKLSDTIREAEWRLHKMESEGADVFEVEPLKQNLWEMYDSSKELNSALEELPQQLENAEKERNRIYKAAVTKSREVLERLRRDDNPVIQLFLQLYENKEDLVNLARVFSDFGDYSSVRMYQWGSFYFILPETIPLNLPYRTVRITTDGIDDNGILEHSDGVTRPYCLYGDSWFSPQAHTDILTLKSEYRNLAKQYHPDVCGEIYAEELFQEILNEYETLCSKMI